MRPQHESLVASPPLTVGSANNISPQTAFRLQHQLGVMLRAVRQLVCSEHYNDVVILLTTVATEIQVDGLLQVSGFRYRQVQRCGGGLAHHSIGLLRRMIETAGKIQVEEQLMVFKWPGVLLAVDVHAMEPAVADKLRDDMALLLDSVQAWLDRHGQRLEKEAKLSDQLMDLRSVLESGMLTLNSDCNSLADWVIAEFASMLPLLALESDQENAILDILHNVMAKVKGSMERQSETQQDILQVVQHMLAFLAHNVTSSEETMHAIASVELF